MKCAHCGGLCGHNIHLSGGDMFCSDECAERYDERQAVLSDD